MPRQRTTRVSQPVLDYMLRRHQEFLDEYNRTGLKKPGRLNLKKRSFRGRDFKGACLSQAVFSVCDFREALMDGCVMNEISAEGCNFNHASMVGVSMARGIIEACKFNAADLSKAQLNNMRAERMEAKRTKFHRSHLTSTDFGLSDFRHASFIDCRVKWARMRGANFDGATIQGGKWRKADLSGSSIHLANLGDEVDGIGIVHGSLELGAPILGYAGRDGPCGVYKGQSREFIHLEEHLRRNGRNDLSVAVRFYRALVEWD